MKKFNNRYIKIMFLFICMFLLVSNIHAADAGFNSTIDKQCIRCNGEEIPYGVPYIVHNVVNLIKVFVPVILIIVGMIDFGKAVIASDEKKMKEGSSKFIRRVIAAVAVFLVITIVQFAFRLLGSEGDTALGCVDCFISGNCGTPKTCAYASES